jgi:cation diffusion facilitator CzcD-associated flavoprotein CzcO
VDSDTVIVGASAAGLAVAACLLRARVPFVLLEQSQQVGAAWRNHYERLHLHTSKRLSGLPYFGFERQAARYPSRQEVIAYLEAYARHFALAPRFGQRVQALRRDGDGWLVRSDDAELRARHVVIATGNTRVPVRPQFPGLDEFVGPVAHSSEYQSGAGYAGQRVLVVGFGNSGGEIAIDLCEHGAHPTIAVRSAVNIVPRDFLGIPILAWGIALSPLPTRLADAIAWLVSRLTIGPLSRLGLRKLPYGPTAQIRRQGRIPLIDIGTVARIKRGEIAIAPGIERFTDAGARFTDGQERPFDAVVLATGYRPALDTLLEGAQFLDGEGAPTRSGHELAPGLFCCGFYVAPTGMLREIAIEARRIARAIVRRR